MDPKRERDEARKKRDQAQQLLNEADELEADADDRENRIRVLDAQIARVAQEEHQANRAGDDELDVELTRQLKDLEDEKRDAQGGNASIF